MPSHLRNILILRRLKTPSVSWYILLNTAQAFFVHHIRFSFLFNGSSGHLENTKPSQLPKNAKFILVFFFYFFKFIFRLLSSIIRLYSFWASELFWYSSRYLHTQLFITGIEVPYSVDRLDMALPSWIWALTIFFLVSSVNRCNFYNLC